MREGKIAEEGSLSLYCGFDVIQVITPLIETAFLCVSTHILKKFVPFVYNSVRQFSKGFIKFKTFE